MKKILFILAIMMTMAVSSVCFAADGDDLNKEQKTAETFINVFEGRNIPTYTIFTTGFSDNLKANINEQTYAKLQETIKNRMGNMKEAKFYSYQRFDQGDRITYIASFDKENIVAIVFTFDKNLQMTDFALSPMKTQQEQQ